MKQEDTFARLVKDELERARMNHAPMNSLHEGYAVLLEEVDEFWDEVKLRKPMLGRTLSELIQVAAMAQKIAEDLLGAELKQHRKRYEEYHNSDENKRV